MFDIIDDYRKNSPKFRVGEWVNVRGRQTELLTRLKQYWKRANTEVKSFNPLLTALYSISAISQDPLDIYYIAKEQTTGVANALGFVSEDNFGRVNRHGCFYNCDKEVYMNVSFNDSLSKVIDYTSNEDDPLAYQQWKPIRVKRHPYTDMSWELPTSDRYRKIFAKGETKRGICVIEIDLALLFTQWRIWRSRPESKFEDGTQKSRSNFLRAIPIPNMLEDHIDICFINRLFYKMVGLVPDNFKLSDRMSFSDTYFKIDEIIDFYLNKLRTSMVNAHQITDTIILPSGKTLGEFYKLPDVPRVHQNKLALSLPIFDYYKLIFGLLEKSENTKRATHFIQDFKWSNRAYRNGNVLRTIKGLNLPDLITELDLITSFMEG